MYGASAAFNPYATKLRKGLEDVVSKYNDPLTAVSDYATGALVGGLGQAGMNWATDGSDPNPLISGLLGAPIQRTLAQIGRASTVGRGKVAFEAVGGRGPVDPNWVFMPQSMRDEGARLGLNKFIQDAPIEIALGSAAMLGAVPTGAATSIYNVATGGQDIDNNLTSSIGGLAALAPIAYMLMKKRQQANQTVPF
tara:strand:- start:8241 stop:8825 length:585 start_codon:yes stop_codon:yes gene_type:complete